MITTQLIDKRNFAAYAQRITCAIQAAPFTGLDCETEDSRRHDGLNAYCKYKDDGFKAANTKLVFDMRRIVMCGFSVFPEGHNQAYYLNLNHADRENRLTWEQVKPILDALPADSYWVAHNAPFERTVFASCFDYDLPRIVCTLQMAVSAYGPDEYQTNKLITADMTSIAGLLRQIGELSHGGYNPLTREMAPELADLAYKIVAKEASSAHSYNGLIDTIVHGYGLKRAVKTFFNHDMTTFAAALRGHPHMGCLTGDDVAFYGAEDAYWALRLFRYLLDYMTTVCPESIPAFFDQENPMTRVYSDIWRGGMKVNTRAIYRRRDEEREDMAQVLRDLKAAVLQLLPFHTEPHLKLLEVDKAWYPKNWQKYRQQVVDWVCTVDHDDAYRQCQQVRGPVSNAWAAERGDPESQGINLSHYMPVRTLIYDLLQQKLIISEGKTQSDATARGRLKDRVTGAGKDLIDGLAKLAGIEQRMKLYLTPYTQLMDPETGCMYPNVSSMLASRRMAASYPNPMQLAKRGESTYVRGFFEADEKDHVIVSIDWSAIELLIIGELSGDLTFFKAYGQLPHDDLHAGAAADIISVDVPGLTEAAFKDLMFHAEAATWQQKWNLEGTRLFTDLKGQPILPKTSYKYWRTEAGKKANFNYWYSGWLASVGDQMGWSRDKTAEATDRYRARFPQAEDWRLNTITQGRRDGRVPLPDGHFRSRFEATDQWKIMFLSMLHRYRPGSHDNYDELCQWITNKIQRRAGNQLVNSIVQGTCAALAKRSVLRVRDLPGRFRFMIPIHDELLWSVHRDDAVQFIRQAREVMITHPDLFSKCKLDASPAVGLTFEPWDAKKAPLGQVELFEAPKSDFIPEARWGKRLNDDEVQGVIDHLFKMRNAA